MDASAPHDSARQRLRRVAIRAAIFVSLLVVEFVALSLRFDGLLFRYEGWWQKLAHLVTFATLSTTGVLMLAGPTVFRDLRETIGRHELPNVWPGLVGHLASIVAMFGVAHSMEHHDWSLRGFGFMAVALGLTAFASAATAMLAVLSRPALAELGATQRRPIVLGIAAGAGAFGAGAGASLLWKPLAGLTVLLTAALLRLVSNDVTMIPEVNGLGVGEFVVTVADGCSGLEGIGLILIFLGLYMWQNRASLRFPRALLLLPIATLAIYLANLVRIAALIMIGAHYSPSIALGGFHSKAGWIFFCVVALSIVAAASRWSYVRLAPKAPSEAEAQGPLIAAPFLVPLIVTIATTMVTGLFAPHHLDPFYGLRVVGVVIVLYAYREDLLALPRKATWRGPTIGIVVFIAWLVLVPVPTADEHAGLQNAIDQLGNGKLPWLVLRVIGTVITVPIAEELAFRGFLLRRIISPAFEDVPFDRLQWFALIVSSVIFGALHQGQFIAGSVAGLAYGVAMIASGSLLDAVIAHAITNALLAGYAIFFSQWAYL